MSAIAMPAPSPVLAEVLERAADPDEWERFELQLAVDRVLPAADPAAGRSRFARSDDG